MHFLRAMYYFHLANIYGGVPIITDVYSLEDDFQIERSSYKETIDFIIDDIDKAVGLLPEDHSGVNRGRVTKGAALALKSRVLLYAASDLYNTEIFPEYQNQDLIRYTDNNRTERWLAAKNAAKAVIDMNKYSLYQPNPASAEEAAENYFNVFVTKDTEEDIFVKYFTVTVGQRWGLYTSPNGYHGWGASAPLGNLIDDYEMADGTKFDWSNPEHAAEPYKNREPRFYGTILHNEAPWRVRPADEIGRASCRERV